MERIFVDKEERKVTVVRTTRTTRVEESYNLDSKYYNEKEVIARVCELHPNATLVG